MTYILLIVIVVGRTPLPATSVPGFATQAACEAAGAQVGRMAFVGQGVSVNVVCLATGAMRP